MPSNLDSVPIDTVVYAWKWEYLKIEDHEKQGYWMGYNCNVHSYGWIGCI